MPIFSKNKQVSVYISTHPDGHQSVSISGDPAQVRVLMEDVLSRRHSGAHLIGMPEMENQPW